MCRKVEACPKDSTSHSKAITLDMRKGAKDRKELSSVPSIVTHPSLIMRMTLGFLSISKSDPTTLCPKSRVRN